METMEQVLRSHAEKYPLMEPKDAVKLIYQNVFGGGHLIRDPEACLNALSWEYAATAQEPEGKQPEDIGNGMVRVYLGGLDAAGYTVEQLGQVFLQSAREHRGSLEEFLRKLTVLRKVTGEGVFSFDSGDLEAYLEGYEKDGYPMVSHSDRYRAAYRPAYRIVQQDLL